MNIITQADVDKFLVLLKAGLKHGIKKDLTTYVSEYDDRPQHFVKLEFSFRLLNSDVQELFIEQDFDIGNQIDEMLK